MSRRPGKAPDPLCHAACPIARPATHLDCAREGRLGGRFDALWPRRSRERLEIRAEQDARGRRRDARLNTKAGLGLVDTGRAWGRQPKQRRAQSLWGGRSRNCSAGASLSGRLAT